MSEAEDNVQEQKPPVSKVAIWSKSSKKQVLLVGDYDYDIWQGIVHKYELVCEEVESQ